MFDRAWISVAFWLAAAACCPAQPAHFWLSTSSVSPSGPEAPTINVSNNGTAQIHVWGRPIEAKKFDNFSLNIVATQAGIDFLNTGIVVYNNITGPVQRFELVSDSSSVPAVQSTRTRAQVLAGQADSIRGLQGFTLMPSSTIRGVGATCVAGEANCFLAADGLPAWLVASVSFTALQPASMTEVFLQIGERGINHAAVLPGDHDFNGVVDDDDYGSWRHDFASNAAAWADSNLDGVVDVADYVAWRKNFGGFGVAESSSLTSVLFGIGPTAGVPEPTYDGFSNRQVTLTGDHADALIQVAASGGGGIAGVPEPSTLVSFLLGLFLAAVWNSRPFRPTRGQLGNQDCGF
jgi:hypothetical protein